MSTKLRKLISAAMCFVCIAALTACQEGGLFVNNDENGNSYTLSDEIIIPASMLRSINPVTSIDEDFFQISSLIYESLVTLDDTLAPVGELADSWSFTDDGAGINFNLKSGIKFSDGSAFDADDVVYSFNAYKSSSESAYVEKVKNIKSVSASGSTSVSFSFSDSNSVSISDFDFPILSSGQYSSKDIKSVTEEAVVGTGMYMMDSVDMKQSISLSANPDYHGEKATNHITVSMSPVADPYIGFVKVNDISIAVETQTDREDLEGDKELTVTQFTSNEFETLGFNCESGAFANAALRKAVAYMIDKDEIIGAAYYNSGAKSDDLYFPGYYGTETKNDINKDEDKAKQLLQEAGYSDTDGDGFVESQEGKTLSVKLAVNSENQSRMTAANLMAISLRSFGVDVSIVEVSGENFLKAISSDAYDMFIGGWKVSEDYDLRSFYHSGYSNYAHYSNAELDTYLDKMASGIDTDSYKAALTSAKKIIDDEVPYVCLLYKTYAAVTSSNLDGLVAPRFNDYYYACSDWKIRVYNTEDDSEESDSDTAADNADTSADASAQ